MRVGLFFGSFDPPHIGHVNVVMGAINSSQWAFNHRHLIEGIFYTYVDYEEVEGLDDLFAE